MWVRNGLRRGRDWQMLGPEKFRTVVKHLEVGVMPPVFALAFGLMGAAALVRWCVKEVQRVNAELDDVRARTRVEPVDRNSLPTLRQDPATGEYRPG